MSPPGLPSARAETLKHIAIIVDLKKSLGSQTSQAGQWRPGAPLKIVVSFAKRKQEFSQFQRAVIKRRYGQPVVVAESQVRAANGPEPRGKTLILIIQTLGQGLAPPRIAWGGDLAQRATAQADQADQSRRLPYSIMRKIEYGSRPESKPRSLWLA